MYGKSAFGSCLVFVSQVATYHEVFAGGLRQAFGRIPTAGLPRTTRLRPGHTRYRARVLAARAELAVAMGETEIAQTFRLQLQQVPLSQEKREQYHDELQAADYLEQWLTKK